MWTSLRQAISNAVEGSLRWLTASVIRSTAIFVILTFVPILLLTYYIVASSIQNTKAAAAAADLQVSDSAVSLLRADFRIEREALVGAADESSLPGVLSSDAQFSPGVLTPVQIRRELPALGRAREAASANLRRLWVRHPEFTALALYDATGGLQASAPAAVPVAVTLANPSLPAWFLRAAAGHVTTSPVLPANNNLPRRLAFAVPVTFNVPTLAHAAPAAATNGTGVLIGWLPVSVVDGWVQQISVGADQYLYLVDSAKNEVSASPSGPFTPDQIAALPATAAALQGQTGSGEYVAPIQLESHDITYAALPDESMALLVVRPVRFGFYIFRVFYDKLAFIAVIIFLLAVATGLLLRAAFRYYQRYNREVESGRAKTEALLGSIGDGVFAVDSGGRIIEFNPAAAELTGLSESQALHRHYTEVIDLVEDRPGAPTATPPDPVRQAMAEGHSLRFLRDLSLLRHDATRLPVTVSAAPVRDEGGGVAGCIVVFSDASQEREVDRMKNEFISIASHQLRTPMSGVKGVLSLLLEEVLGPLNPEQRKYLARANESNERLIALVNDLLNTSRLEQGSLQLRQEPISLGEMVQTLVTEFQPRASRYHQTLRLENVPGAAGDNAPADTTVLGDPVRLREVFSNLVDNAIKYTPESGAITVRLKADAQQVQVEVSDTGVGIPEEKIPSLFQKFNRIQNPLSGREFGTGLGLYFARSVVELHQGRIEVESHLGQGTTFRVCLPRQRGASAKS